MAGIVKIYTQSKKRWVRFICSNKLRKKYATRAFIKRVKLKKEKGDPITVVFVCHEPAFWNSFESIYYAMLDDPSFSPIIITMPYKHPHFTNGKFKDAGVFEFLEKQGISAIRGYNRTSKKWLNPKILHPDYLFFQTPYPFFPLKWGIDAISLLARVCYVPYGMAIFTGSVGTISKPISFLKKLRFFFLTNPFEKEIIQGFFKDENWFDDQIMKMTGYPNMDYFLKPPPLDFNIWRHGEDQTRKRIVWSPRWNTYENTCHFFDYKDFFATQYADSTNIDFVFRPHPLCFQNFLKTGELTLDALQKMRALYKNSTNMNIDETGDYRAIFQTCDLFISDISSMLPEFFATGKPIIYTHRVDHFNVLGKALAKGFYWVRNEKELKETLNMLLAGKDPLKEIRKKIIKEVLFLPKEGAGHKIMETLRSDYNQV